MELRRRERIITVPRNVVSDARATYRSFRARKWHAFWTRDASERAFSECRTASRA